MHLRRPTPVVYAITFAVVLVVFQSFFAHNKQLAGRHYKVKVARVYDGDTFETSNGKRVRLLGIDSPEVQHGDSVGEPFGPESGEWLRSLIGGRTVILQEGVEAIDRYGRTLGWIYLSDGRLVNELALRTGNAELLDRFGLPLELEQRLRDAEQQAKSRKLGMWQDRDPKVESSAF